jgi:hypothetical protein
MIIVMTADGGYEAWLRSNPAPDLQELVRRQEESKP